jgi:hypothetical protein
VGVFLVDLLQYFRYVGMGIIFGENAISVYVLAGMLAILVYEPYIGGQSISGFFMQALTAVGIGGKLASLCFALCCVGINFIPAYFLHTKRILIRL